MQKICKNCQQNFEITDEDLKFYEKVSPVFNDKKYLIPQPTLCYECRQQRKLAFRNERVLYKRKCDLCKQQIISIYSPDKPFQVYCQKCIWSDKYDPIVFGRNYDFNKSFFEQFSELMLKVPVMSVNLQAGNENCDYTNLTSYNKNSYLIFAALKSEDCYYCTYLHRCKNVLDSLFIFDSELCYECVDCYFCYKVFLSQYCNNCTDSYFLYDCKKCSNCFCCVGMKNKSYCFLNQQYSKQEYIDIIDQLLKNPQWLIIAKQKFLDLQKIIPHKYYQGINNENVSGDHISFSKNLTNCFDCNYSEECKNCTWLHESKNCHDCYAWGQTGELGYENHLCGNNFYNVQFSASCWNNVSNLLYCYFCINNVSDCFGCIGLNHKKYCILNKQYSKKEYEQLVPKIIEAMKSPKSPLTRGLGHPLDKGGLGDCEWGEFFPSSISPFGYNETVAQEYFPTTKEQALSKNYKWKDEEKNSEYFGPKIEIPDNIDSVKDEIINQILNCESCNKYYKIIKQELKFYRSLKLPIPKNCPDCRHRQRLSMRNPRKLWTRNCMKCNTEIQTTYPLERKEIVYCEKCYLETIY